MELSKRLLAVASLVTPGSRVADIGTDHAYIPLYLIQEKKAVGAIAMDVNEGPLLRAKEHVRDAGLQEKIRLRRSDGLEQLNPGECDCAVIAGMGGGLMIRILSAHLEITKSLRECILQPQSEIERVRAFLLQEGFLFLQEDMVLDDGKYYMMMKVRPPYAENETSDLKKRNKDIGTKEEWDAVELRYGKLLLEMRHPVLFSYLQREKEIHERILSGLDQQEGAHIDMRKQELQHDLKEIGKGLEYYALQ